MLAWACAMAMTTVVIGISILGRVQENPTELALALTDELTSLGALAMAFFVPGFIALWMRRQRPSGPAIAGVLTAGLVAFAILHIGICASLRTVLYPMIAGETYGFHLLGREGPFEFGKDVIAFAASTTGVIVLLARRLTPAVLSAPSPASKATFDILGGSKLVRVPLGEILAIRSAGNYAEFFLSDGRRQLMRSSLSGLEARLAANGFIRTHRSWLVNRGRVKGLSPEGSGDYAVDLGEVSAPVSRRYPDALAALRAD